jgi:hypothetical protein
MLFICYTPAQRPGFSRTAPSQWCLSPMSSPADAAFRPRNAEPARRHFLPASLASLAESPRTPSGWATSLHCHILLSMAALNRCTSPPQIILPHAAHGTDSSCLGGESYSRRFTCCQSTHRLYSRFLSRLLTARHPFFSTPVRDTQTRLKCHSPLTRKALLDLFSLPLLATSGTHCRFTAAPACISHRRPISLYHRTHISLSAIAAFVLLPVTSSQRLPSSPPLIPATTQFVPHSLQSLTFLHPNFLSH